jgi:hypothetical protein
LLSIVNPGKAIQWGYIGDVGIVQDNLGGNEYYHMGMVPQRIPSFLETLEIFLMSPGVIYSSIQSAKPKGGWSSKQGDKASIKNDVVSVVLGILGECRCKVK